MKSNPEKTLVVIAGPTGVGKTALSLEIASHYKTEIISADARQFYREIRIGTAAPTESDLKAVRHHFIGQLSVSDQFNVSSYEEQALKILESLFRRHDHVVLAGGSGLYIDTLCQGMDKLPGTDDEVRAGLKQFYEAEGLVGLRNWLKRVDPAYYDRVDPANPNRMMRGLEIFLQTGIPYSQYLSGKKAVRPFRLRMIVLNRDRDELFARINLRADQMIRQGLIEEALSIYPYRHLNALNTVGYKELYAWLSNRWPLNMAIEKIKTHTRRYARRQITWFRRYKDAAWFHPDDKTGIFRYIG